MHVVYVYPRLRRRRPLRLRGLLLFPSGVIAFLLLAAPVAMADDPIGDAIGSATETINSATGTVANVDNAVDSTTDTVDNAVDSTTDTVDNAVDSTTDTIDVGRVIQTVNRTADTPTSAGGAASGLRRSYLLPRGAGSSPSIDLGSGAPGESTTGNTPSELALLSARRDADPQTDPCQEDSDLVCLGLLFGLGDFASTGSDVLSTLVRTGAAVVVLAAIALFLGTLGAGALAASRHDFDLAPGRAD